MDEAKGERNNRDLKMQDGDLGAAEAGTNEIASGEARWSATDSNAPRVNGSRYVYSKKNWSLELTSTAAPVSSCFPQPALNPTSEST